jgi:hypothetical protein
LDSFVSTPENFTAPANAPLFFQKDVWELSERGFAAGYYRPLLLLSFAFDHHIWGLNPLGYQITGRVLHLPL